MTYKKAKENKPIKKESLNKVVAIRQFCNENGTMVKVGSSAIVSDKLLAKLKKHKAVK